MTVQVLKTAAAIHAVLEADCQVRLYELAADETRIVESPPGLQPGQLDYRQPGDPLFETV